MTEIPNVAEVVPGVWRGGQPTTLDQWQWLRSLGVSRSIKLNMETEATDSVAVQAGIFVCHYPIDLCEQLCFKPVPADVEAAVSAIALGTYVHCSHGQDRTGLLVGCWRVWFQGWSKDQAWAEMLAHGYHPALLGLTLFWEQWV